MFKKRLFGIMTIIIGFVFTFSFTSCSPLQGTWQHTNGGTTLQYTFRGSNFQFMEQVDNGPVRKYKGTFSINEEETEISFTYTHFSDVFGGLHAYDTPQTGFKSAISISGDRFIMGSITFTKK